VTDLRRTGVFGGTFDPIHLGHLAVAAAACRAFGLDTVLLMPSNQPPHRETDPAASVFHRFAMVALAAQHDPRLVACDLEAARRGRSYTADTIRTLQASGLEPWQIFFLTGADAFADIATWHEYPALVDLAHFVVCSRPGWPVTSLQTRLPDLAARMIHAAADAALLLQFHPRAGAVGNDLRENRRTSIFLLDCPTPGISSTDIRARARAGRPLAGLVPPEVDLYIRRHGLYGAPPEPVASGRPAASNLHE
jgi:nicotinate-nucleotide adenylyltransferase